MGAVEFLFALKGVDCYGAEYFFHPAAEGGRISNGPSGASHLPPGPEAGFLSNSQVHIGVAPLVGDAHDAFEAGWLAALIHPGAASFSSFGRGCCGRGER